MLLVTGLIGRAGDAAIAGYGIGSRLEYMLVPISFGIGATLTALVGTNIGARQFARAQRVAWTRRADGGRHRGGDRHRRGDLSPTCGSACSPTIPPH